jgi:DNA-binding PadR family transcriptional regulator
MSPVFRHGRLRLYLLKLLDESPRHGYEVIRLLQDRFMGVYAPSPGTIYPRLARLEEEGLVTHDETDGRKVYRITDKGREELRARLDDLTELEDEITASVRDIAREVSEDVRETVRSLREELTWAAREFHTRAHQAARGAGPAPAGAQPAGAGSAGTGPAGAEREHEPGEGREQREGARRERDEARRGRDEARRGRGRAKSGRDDAGEAWAGHRGPPWGGPQRGEWPGWRGWGGWPGGEGWPGGAGPHGCADPGAYRDLERLARQFTRELRSAAWHAQTVGEDAMRDLRTILEETIERIKTDVFAGTAPQEPGDTPPGDTPSRDTPPSDGPG